jgi:hypothetical protein
MLVASLERYGAFGIHGMAIGKVTKTSALLCDRKTTELLLETNNSILLEPTN